MAANKQNAVRIYCMYMYTCIHVCTSCCTRSITHSRCLWWDGGMEKCLFCTNNRITYGDSAVCMHHQSNATCAGHWCCDSLAVVVVLMICSNVSCFHTLNALVIMHPASTHIRIHIIIIIVNSNIVHAELRNRLCLFAIWQVYQSIRGSSNEYRVLFNAPSSI